jgi:hypothetical protein
MVELLGQIDVVFVMDTTGSMMPYLDEARQHARAEADRIAAENDLDIQFAVVEYRDHPPQEATFIRRVYPFGDSAALDQALAQLEAVGGGDTPEAVWDGLAAAGNLRWRQTSDKLCFMIGDSPPHGYMPSGAGDAWPAGCPCGLTAGGIIELFAARGITLNAHSIAGLNETTTAFREVAEATGGACTVVDRPEASTAAYSAAMAERSETISDARAYFAAASAPPGGDGESLAETLGWTAERRSRIERYLSSRGIRCPREGDGEAESPDA